MKTLYLSLFAVFAALSGAHPDIRRPGDSDPILKRLTDDLIDAYHRYAPDIREEIKQLQESNQRASGTMSVQQAPAEKTKFHIQNFTDFERNLPDGNPFYVGQAVLDEVTPQVARALGEKLNRWIPNGQDYVKLIHNFISDEQILTFQITETNLFEGLNTIEEVKYRNKPLV
ncbi:HGL312Wp [Eremothecium sinecaudum]|uniref:HGL312Wp n=1 Tax=Eremothecium sinecaudum TaxID=45286 RepID=A0A0X8HV86_9SACH|nr:HGL312Wp [Eremothecium sinecaudum]AMD22028.1 HGL312Wp [Eremothecium sinecaudum]